ncbi:MAG: preprotein translocase subunit YajC [Clostridiales Family XIII bacterium]|jgi:preprotein translocase subunit YajC|nr:preprotein translocase subunit YajC [Clostridiales Family XIII bacterium]
MNGSQLVSLLPIVAIFVVFYFIFIRPQKKKENDITKMRNAIKAGDKIITIGGIKATVVKTNEDSLTISVGADKTKFEVMRWSVSRLDEEKKDPKTTTKSETKKDDKNESTSEETTSKRPKKLVKDTTEAK